MEDDWKIITNRFPVIPPVWQYLWNISPPNSSFVPPMTWPGAVFPVIDLVNFADHPWARHLMIPCLCLVRGHTPYCCCNIECPSSPASICWNLVSYGPLKSPYFLNPQVFYWHSTFHFLLCFLDIPSLGDSIWHIRSCACVQLSLPPNTIIHLPFFSWEETESLRYEIDSSQEIAKDLDVEFKILTTCNWERDENEKYRKGNVLSWFRKISSVQSLSHVRLFATSWTTACQASLSITSAQTLLKLMPIESVMPSKHLILCPPLLLLPPLPSSIRVFSNESTLRMRVAKVLEFQLQRQSFQ